MYAVHLAVTLLASAVYGSAAVANLTGHAYPLRQADTMRVPRSWVAPLGALLGAGAVGLLAGLVVPVLGTLAAVGLVLYFAGALGAHLRVGDRQLGGWGVCAALALAALTLNLATYGPGGLAL
ncbi:DoxX family protein [Streptomyces daliensis]|uniref:DoxX family protein n=1 Tax=Streptomyces daliensis TaxID=299421 RepID=A0A8T4IS14_9ACTN|nr:DoxX family protein [Streptomyces daliensis]